MKGNAGGKYTGERVRTICNNDNHGITEPGMSSYPVVDTQTLYQRLTVLPASTFSPGPAVLGIWADGSYLRPKNTNKNKTKINNGIYSNRSN